MLRGALAPGSLAAASKLAALTAARTMDEGGAASAAALSDAAEVETLGHSLAALNLPALATSGPEEGTSCVPCPLPEEMLRPPCTDGAASAARDATVRSLTAGWTCPGKTCPGGNCLVALLETAEG